MKHESGESVLLAMGVLMEFLVSVDKTQTQQHRFRNLVLRDPHAETETMVHRRFQVTGTVVNLKTSAAAAISGHLELDKAGTLSWNTGWLKGSLVYRNQKHAIEVQAPASSHQPVITTDEAAQEDTI